MALSHVEVLKETLATYGDLLKQEAKKGAAEFTAPAASPTPAAPPKPKPKVVGITRPNGVVYIPREIKALDTTDVSFIETAYAAKMPVLLYGPPGTGKTALLEAALPNLVTMMGTAEAETSDFIGTWVQRTDGMYEWVDGPLVVAIEGGHPFLIDEIALIDARTMSVVYSVMDGRDELPITANPARGVAKVKEGFTVYGACNPDVPGAIMSDALLSRFKIHVHVKTDWNLAKRLGVGAKIITVAKNLDIKATNGEVVAPPQLRELLTFQECSAIYGETVAIRNFLAQARPEDRVAFSNALASVFGAITEPLTF
jgi:midasin (ATPase involved in ribosome maturation)